MLKLHYFCLMALVTLIPSLTQAEIDETPLKMEMVRAFPNLRLTRPIVVTHAGTDDLYVAEQEGKIHVFPYEQDVKKTDVFMNLQSKVRYYDKQNEEGLLGFAFHPRFKENGEFFIYYTTKETPHTSIISRFRTKKGDPRQGDLSSEEELMRLKQPFWNHNGGTLCFGPDGYLYIALGDGGGKNDPHGHGQNLNTLLGSILRIDVDKKENGKNYAIPKDNPFAGRKDARPEIYAYGIRNIWRMSFDQKTGLLYAADVGQNLWEEINIVSAGGNYGWNKREGMHPFGEDGQQASKKFIEPIFEYDHETGKSITGGDVYRGKAVPELDGYYLYADYVSGRLWGLKYDHKAEKVVANREIKSENMPVITFGSAADGEVYFTDTFGQIWQVRPQQ